MPFTLTHVGAILPITALWPRKMPFSALAIGAMIPDLPLYLPYLAPGYFVMHSLPGLLTVCLPAGIALFLCFQVFLKEPLFQLCPRWVQQRTADLRLSCVRPQLAFFCLSSCAVLLGAATHLGWDSFTHPGRWGTRLLPVLNQEWFHFPNGVTVVGARVLQHGSTALLLPGLCVAAYVWLASRPTADHEVPSFTRRTKGLAVALLVALAVWTTWFVWCEPHPGIGWKLNRWVTHFGFLLLLASVVYALAYHACVGAEP